MSTEEDTQPILSNTQEKKEENQSENTINSQEGKSGTTPLTSFFEKIESSLLGSTPQEENLAKEEEHTELNNNENTINNENKNSDKESEIPEYNEDKIKPDTNASSEIFESTQPSDFVQPSSEFPNDKSSTSSSKTDNENSQNEDQERELEEAIDELVHHFKPPPQELRAPMMQYLEKRRVEALIEGDYDLAEKQDKIAGILQTVLQNEQQKINEDKTIDILYGRWQQLIQKQNQVNAKWDAKVQEFIADSDRQKEEMEIAHEEEVDNFLSKWKDPSFLRPFNKPSSKLLQLREQEKAMAISRMYSQAKEMKAIADRLQREETQQAQAKISATMSMERNKLAAKQNKEVNAWNSYRTRMLKSFQAERQKELRPIQTAMQQIKAKKSSPLKGSGAKRQHYGISNSALPVLPNSRATSAMSEASTRSAHKSQKGASSNTNNANNNNNNNNDSSPRTRYMRFISEKKTTLLDVGPVDEATLLAMKKPPTSRPRSTAANATSRTPTVKRTQMTKKIPNRK